MTDERSFMSVGMSGAVQGHPNPHSNPQADQQDFAQGYSQQPDDDPYRRGSPSNVSFTGRSLYPPARPSSQAYGGPMSVQLPSLNGVFHDPTRSLYGPGTSALPPGPYGGPSPSDENLNTFRLPLGATVPSSHPPLQYDYQPHHQQDFHHDRHSAHSQASYRNHPHPPEHPSPSVTPNIPSNSSPGPSTYPQPRQHHPHQQLAPSMMYTPHPPEPSSSAFHRSFAPSGPQPYTNSHSSPSLSPQLEGITSAAPPSTSDPVKTEDRPAPGVTASSSRSTKRREKPKIELAPDQPLTTQGKPRARVYVACIQCRTRKIRCDGAKPVCHNCSRRQSMNSSARNADAGSSSGTSPTSPTTSDPLGPCCYDAAPKRRGPDKNPGSRQRISHAQRDLEIMGMNGTADGGKVKRRRRRDTNAVPTAIAAGTAGALLEPGTSSSLQDTSTIDKQLGSGISREPATRSNLASGAVSEVPTDGAAHSPVSMSVPSSSTSMSLGHVVGSGAVSGPISGSGSAAESIPPSSLHMPPGVAGADDFGQQMVTNSNGPGHMRSPDSYRNVPGQMRVPQGMSHQLGPHYSHTTDPRISAERTHSLQREGYTSLQPDGIHRVYTGHDGAYSTMSTRLQVQIPSQGGQQQPRPLRTDVPRLISPAQEYPHTHSHHQTLSYQPQNTTHTPAHISNALGYLTPPYDVPRPYQSMATISSVEEYENESESSGSRAVGTISERRPEIGAGPSVQFARVQLALNTNQPLSPGLRESLGQQVTADLKFLFRASNYWFSFVNVPRFFSRLLDPAQRPSLQPSLVLAALACANLTRSSEQEDGKDGRDWALTLLSLAQAALEASTNSGWIDETLVQASWMMTFFEVSAHPAHTGIRVQSALTMLDNLIASLSLSVLDRNDDRTCRFGSRTVPIVGTSSPVPAPDSPRHTAWSSPASALLTATSIDTAALHHPPGTQTQTSTTGLISASAPSCGCHALTLGQNSRYANDLTPLWLMTPAWSPDAPDPEIRKEECRRVVWSAVTLIAGYTSYVAALNAAPQLRLSLMDPSNIVLLFPAETLSPSLSANQTLMKSTIWALYMRTMILWHSCLRMRWDVHQSDASKAEFAVGAWLEIDRIEKALNSHTCGVERAFLFQGREYLFNTRMCISYEFQRFIPQATANANMIFHRKKAEEWLTHQAQVAKQTMFGLQSITHQPNVTFARRPFFVFWFMSQVSRALLLWSCDNSLTVALDVSKALLAPIEYLMSIWPCPEQQVRYHNLRVRLDHACLSAGVPLPTPYIANSSHLPQSLAS